MSAERPARLQVADLRAAAAARAASQVVERSPEVMRRLALLWDPPAPATRGRPARFTLSDVVRAGIEVAAAEGLEALSMRKVAKTLDVGAMSLYTYVPGRAELVDLMVDRAYQGLDLPEAGQHWRVGLARYARAFWDLYLRHPWLLQVNRWRAPLAPHVLDAQEAGLRTLAETVLEPVEVVRTVALVDTVVQGMARARVAEDAERQDTGIDMDQFWASVSSFWEDYFDAARYPTMTRLYLAGAFDSFAGEFDEALERLLTVVERSMTTAGPPAADRPRG